MITANETRLPRRDPESPASRNEGLEILDRQPLTGVPVLFRTARWALFPASNASSARKVGRGGVCCAGQVAIERAANPSLQ